MLSTLALHMQTVAIGWQLYALTGSALDLGLIGLVQFVPTVVLTLVVGQVADRYDRRLVVGICYVAQAMPPRRSGSARREAGSAGRASSPSSPFSAPPAPSRILRARPSCLGW